ncbi:hypothetical protein ILYODFUR_019360 [Ilyodon furcidens]|uniref:F-box domain-containing protein n=1 Tax=Ilyodon furcidens TaxID=33524 RepID=A0ABV0UTC2_9TELE
MLIRRRFSVGFPADIGHFFSALPSVFSFLQPVLIWLLRKLDRSQLRQAANICLHLASIQPSSLWSRFSEYSRTCCSVTPGIRVHIDPTSSYRTAPHAHQLLFKGRLSPTRTSFQTA